MLNLRQLGEYITERHTTDLFRLETLPHYDADSDDDDFARYLRGEPSPQASVKEPFLQRLRADTAAGRIWRRVHTIRQPLSDYLRYECEWGYTYNVSAGEDVRILDVDTFGLAGFESRVGDFFVIDHRHVVRSVYDDHHRFAYAHTVEDPDPYLAVADLAWSIAESFTRWWAAHPEYHRGARAA